MVADNVVLSIQSLTTTGSALTNMVFSNTGTSDALDLQGTVSTSSPYLNFTDWDLQFTPSDSTSSSGTDYNDGRCYAGDTCTESEDFSFALSWSGVTVTFEIDLVDGYGSTYHLEEIVVVY